MASVVVVGGGVAGLAAAWELSGAGHEVTVLEATDRVGGKLRSAAVAGRSIDVGAESVLWRRPEARTLLGELGADVTHPARVPAAIWSRGALHPIPTGTLMGIPAHPEALEGLLTTGEVARATAEQPVEVDGDDAPLGEVVAAALGEAVVDRLVEPLLGGVYAGHARLLSARAVLPVVNDAVRQGNSLIALAQGAAAAADSGRGEPVFATVPGGLGTLPGLLAERLAERGVRLRTGAVVRHLERAPRGWLLTLGDTRSPEPVEADAVLLATPAAPTARLLADLAPDAADALGQIEYASMVLVTYAFPSHAVPAGLTGRSGFLVPPVEGADIKASTFSSSKWPWLAEQHPDLAFVRVSLGRHREAATLQRPDADLAAAGLADLQRIVGQRLPEPVDTHVQRWGGGLPQYAVGHLDRIAVARSAIGQVPGLETAGAAYDGVGIPACIGSGRAAATRLGTHLRGA